MIVRHHRQSGPSALGGFFQRLPQRPRFRQFVGIPSFPGGLLGTPQLLRQRRLAGQRFAPAQRQPLRRGSELCRPGRP